MPFHTSSKFNPSISLRTRVQSSKLSIGFTLVELLIVISIIAILIGVGAVSWTNAQAKARDGQRKSDLKAIQQALETFFQTNGTYPPLVPLAGGWCTIISHSAFTQVRDQLQGGGGQPTYITKVPTDPVFKSVPKDYYYNKTTQSTYELYAVLENANDPDVTNPADLVGCDSWTTEYNFKVTNP